MISWPIDTADISEGIGAKSHLYIFDYGAALPEGFQVMRVGGETTALTGDRVAVFLSTEPPSDKAAWTHKVHVARGPLKGLQGFFFDPSVAAKVPETGVILGRVFAIRNRP